MKNKIGIGVITCNRPDFFVNCIRSVPQVDELVVVNDGKPYSNDLYPNHIKKIVQHGRNQGVAIAKNTAIKSLLNVGCNHIFLVEDDIIIKNHEIIETYIKAKEAFGILHFNYAFHGDGNRDNNYNPISRKTVTADSISITLNKNVLGAFSYYHKSVIEKIGLMDEGFFNGLEHVEHTYRIIQNGYHPPFWWFADVDNSQHCIDDQDKYHEKSVIRKKIKMRFFFWKNQHLFRKKHGVTPWQIPDTTEAEVLSIIESIKLKKK